MNALIDRDPPGLAVRAGRGEDAPARRSRLHDLDEQVQVAGVLVGDARDACDERAVDACAQLDRGAVRPDDDRVAGGDRPRVAASAAESSTSAGGRWNASSPTRSTNGPGEERAVADAAGARRGSARRRPASAAGGLRLGGGSGCLVRRRVPASGAVPFSSRAVDAAEDDARTARRTRPTACGESSTSNRSASFAIQASSSGTGAITARRSRCRRPSRFSERAVALERARRRQHEVGPADGEAVEHRDRDHVLGVLGERAHGRIGRGLVAGDDQQPDRLRGSPRPRRRLRPRRRRRHGRSASPAGGRRRCRACPRSRARARPRRDVRRRRRRCPTRRGSPARTRGAARRARCPARRARGAPPRRRRARSARCRSGRSARSRRRCAAPALQPEVDDGRAVGDVVVADDDDELGGGDRGERQRGRRRARPRSTRAARPRARRARRAAAGRARRPARPSPSPRAR